jgi:hypothetical protein
MCPTKSNPDSPGPRSFLGRAFRSTSGKPTQVFAVEPEHTEGEETAFSATKQHVLEHRLSRFVHTNNFTIDYRLGVL